MRKYILLFLYITTATNLFAQESKIATLRPEEVEVIFLEQNLELIAEKLNISLADAAISQAKLWDNPNISVGDINFWTPKSQPATTQFSIELSQLIQTANKRGKLVNMEKISKEISIRQFEEVLRGLKAELRKSIHEMMYFNAYKDVLKNQTESLTRLINSYTRQVTQGNLPKSELLRLQSALFEVENEYNEIQTEWNAQQKTLKSLLNIDPYITIMIQNSTEIVHNPEELSLANLIQTATDFRPDLQQTKLQTQYFEKSIAYEKAQRVPDINISASYDRYGGVWRDFIGFGVSIDLPFLNRNQGNIKAARISRDQSQHIALQQQNLVQHEIAEAFNNYTLSYNFYKKMSENPLLQELDLMLEVYTKNLLNKNISMIEYIDFMDAYKNNKNTLLSTRKNVFNQFEELQYTVGTDIK